RQRSLARDLSGFVRRQFGERGLEILGLAEIAVDRGETHIGDIVELAQIGHHRFADRLGGYLALAEALELADNLRHHLVDALGLDRPLAQRDLDRPQQLIAIERHAPAVALDDDELAQLHALEGGEAEIARQADAAAADDGGIFRRPRILHLGIEASTARAAHALTLPLIDREPADQALDLFTHNRFRRRVVFRSLARQRVEHLGDHVPDLSEFGDAEAPRGARRRTQPHAGGDARALSG